MRGTPLRTDLTEKEFTGQVVELARTLGWRRYHTWRSKHSAAGWPDEALVRDRLILAELKRRGGRPSAEQREWLDALAGAGVEAYLWTEDDLEEVARILAKRWRLVPTTGAPFLTVEGEAAWTPRSLWLPGAGRAEGIAA